MEVGFTFFFKCFTHLNIEILHWNVFHAIKILFIFVHLDPDKNNLFPNFEQYYFTEIKIYVYIQFFYRLKYEYGQKKKEKKGPM